MLPLRRWLARISARRPRPNPPRPRPRLEPLADRVLFSADLLAGLPFVARPTDPAVAAAWASVVVQENDAPAEQPAPGAADAQERAQEEAAVDAFQSSLPPSAAPPAVRAGDLNIGGESLGVLDLQFGSTSQVVLVFGQPDAPAPQGPGGPPDGGVLGAGIDVQTATGDQRYVLDFDRHFDRAEFGYRLAAGLSAPSGPVMTPGYNPANPCGDGIASLCGLGMSPSMTRGEAMTEMVDSAAPKMTDGAGIADGLARAAGDSDGTSDAVDIDAVDADGQTFALATPDGDLPDARQELMPLHGANLALVSTYVVGRPPAPAAAVATAASDDLSLSAAVVGLDEAPSSSVSPAVEETPLAPDATAAADHLFRRMATEGAPSCEAAASVGRCLGGLVAQGERLLADLLQPGTAESAAPAVMVEAILTFGLWRLTRPAGRERE